MTDTHLLSMLKQGNDDMKWFGSNIEYLKTKYNNKFVAIQNKSVIDSANDLDNLITKLNKKKIEPSSVFIEFISKVKSIL